MSRPSRRVFLAGSAASAGLAVFRRRSAAAPAIRSGDYDTVIIGAGAAGIAAAKRLAAAGKRYLVVEAADHIGGRCVTDGRTFGVPFDRGAHWIHLPGSNPVAKFAPGRGIEMYPAPRSQKVRIGLRYAREKELEDFLAAQVRATRAIDDAARKADVACGTALPSDLGDWRATAEFALGPFAYGQDLAKLSAADFASATERSSDAFCRQGFGALLAAHAAGVAVESSAPATAIDIGRIVTVQTPKGTITARTGIVTVSTAVLAAGRIQFTPDLPQRVMAAFHSLPLGSYDHIALEFTGNPLGLDSDDLVFEKSADARTAAMLGNVSGTRLCLIEVAGSFGRSLTAQGADAMVDFAGEWLGRLYGAQIRKSIVRAAVTRWNAEPLALGAMSAAVPGGHAARSALSEPVRDAVWFAGEAVHESLWGTVGGAWESGERAAAAVLRRLAGEREPQAEDRRRHRRKSKRRRFDNE